MGMSKAGSNECFIGVYHLRRRRLRRWRSIWDRYPSLLVVRLGQVVPCLLERRRYLVGQVVRVVPWVRLGRGHRLGLERRFDRVVRVVRLRRVVLDLREWMECLELEYLALLSLHPCLVVRVVRWGLVGRVGQRRRPWLGFQVVRLVRVLLVRLVGLVDRVDLVGTACMVVE